jgi:hypothetical protein
MTKIKLTLLIAVSTFAIAGCRSQLGVSNGAYSDISLNRNSNEYTIKRLAELEAKSSGIFGIPTDKKVNKKQGLIVRFNGINLSASSRILPMLSMAALSLGTGSAIQSIAGRKTITETTGSGNFRFTYSYEGDNKLSLGLATLLGVPVAGAINNQIWSGSLSRAAWELNHQLVENNPGVDVFLNPKYDIDLKKGIWTQKVVLKAKVMGATIKTDN